MTEQFTRVLPLRRNLVLAISLGFALLTIAGVLFSCGGKAAGGSYYCPMHQDFVPSPQ